MNQSFIEEIARYMQDRGLGTLATTIFYGELPASVTAGVLLIDVASPDPHMYIDHEDHIVEFWYRHSKTDLAYDEIRKIYNTFHRAHHYQTTNWYIYLSKALGNIEDMDRDREGGKLLRLSVQFSVRNLNNIS